MEGDLLAPFNYICEMKGKEVRVMFIKAFNEWLGLTEQQCSTIARITQGLHNASLLIDDIEDNSTLRRGQPAAHVIYGMPITINCANHVYFLVLQELLSLQNADATSVYVSEMVNLHQGQGMDIHWRDTCQCPTLDEYEEMVKKKTGGLFRLSVGLMQAFSENKEDFSPLVNDIAVFFQVLDDYLNLRSEEYHKNKTFAEDLTEGKFSFPIIHAIRSNKNDRRLIGILQQRPTDSEVKRYAISYMDSLGSLDYTKQYVEDRYQMIVDEITRLGGNETLLKILTHLKNKLEPAAEGA